jgi:hypothetical protein
MDVGDSYLNKRVYNVGGLSFTVEELVTKTGR